MEHLTSDTTMEKRILQRASVCQRPINGSLELLPLCNMNCDMCYVRLSSAKMRQRGRLRTADEWIQMGEQMAASGVLFLLLTGGEPLLFPDFQKLYLKLRQLGLILTINTNGTLLNEEWAAFFGRYKPRRMNITLYGADDAAYETLCHYPGGCTKTLRAIHLLKEQGVDVKINGSVTKYNQSDMKAIYEIGRRLEVPVHMDTYMLPGIRERGKAFELQSRLSPAQAAKAELISLKAELHEESFLRYVHQNVRRVETNSGEYTDQVSCLAGNCSFTINWQGEMRPCVTFTKPSVPVFETGFEKAWQKISAGSKEIRINAKCKKCKYRPICKTCAASAYLETGRYDGVPEYLCQYAEEFYRLLQIEAEKTGYV